MKFSISIVTLLLSTLVASDGLSFFSKGAQKVLGDGEAVPGDNPLKFCKKDHSDDLLQLEKVNLTPNPPLRLVRCPTVQGYATDIFAEALLLPSKLLEI